MWIEETFSAAEEVIRKNPDATLVFTWCHASLKLTGQIDILRDSEDAKLMSEEINMHYSCSVCEAQSAIHTMGDGA
jgi:hypothetical protein